MTCTPPGMVEVPAGAFVRGSPVWGDEGAVAEVYLDRFFIDKTEVTVADYARCVDAGSCAPSDDAPGCNRTNMGQDDHPTNCVSWSQANTYCRWVDDSTKELPTEAQWEKAARGTDARMYPWGDLTAPSCDYAVMDDPMAGGPGCGTGGTMVVGNMPAGVSVYGALDMTGNVAEWVGDWYARQYSRVDDRNPTGPSSGDERVTRGGSWNLSKPPELPQEEKEGEWSLRVTYRRQESPELRSPEVGFRCATTVPLLVSMDEG
ncbi:MAG: SUMF1/EgtB/PvdO family nonheme iron enzyme [Myxococcota bacterium]